MTANSRRLLKLGLGAALFVGALFLVGRIAGWWGVANDGAIRLYGNVEIREVELGFRVGGRISDLLVDEGQTIKAGQELARLDQTPLRDRLAGADARVAAATALVDKDASGNRPQDVRVAEATVTDAVAQEGEARRLHDRRRALMGRGFISRADLEASEASLTAARARVDSARAALSLVREGTRSEDRAVTRADADVVQAERRAIQTELGDAVLLAPSNGQVLTRVREAGAIVQPGEIVYTIALTQPVRVRAYVAESDLPKVRPGMKVTVHVDGAARSWPATIGFIAPVAEFTPRTVQTEDQRTDLVYRMRLTVDDPKGDLRQGQPVTVTLDGGAR